VSEGIGATLIPARIVVLVIGDNLPYGLVMVAGRPPAGFD
jgi:hypothetical protein